MGQFHAGQPGPNLCLLRTTDFDLLVHIDCQVFFCSRIHITEDVRQHIGSDYEVEDGHGQARDKYLAENGIKTYFVIADPKRDKHVSS